MDNYKYYSENDATLLVIIALCILNWIATFSIEYGKCVSRDMFDQIHNQKFNMLCDILQKNNDELMHVKEAMIRLKRKPRIEFPVETEDKDKNL